MSMNVTPVKALASVAMGAGSQSKMAKVMSLGESIMPPKGERVAQAKNVLYTVVEKFVEKAKAKPDAERTIVDYILLVAEKLKDINPVKYAA